jgi:DNA-directed RNA polymerase sigma subunit (sigma70/sigma32)
MDDTTPADLSRELSVSAKRIRDYLRAAYGTLKPPTTRWRLTAAQADDVRRHFRG